MHALRHYPLLLLLLGTTLLPLLSSCHGGGATTPALFAPDDYPQKLSQWRLLNVADNELRFADGVYAYDINMPLFSDYAGKLRTLYLPANTRLSKRENGQRGFDYPVGAIISKTFFYYQADSQSTAVAKTNHYRTAQQPLSLANTRLIETRLLVRHADGWHAVSYQWRGDDAYLAITGAIVKLTLENAEGSAAVDFPYLIPSRNQCAGCHATNHTTGKLQPIGVHLAQLHRPAPGAAEHSQLHSWQQRGWLTDTPPAALVMAGWDSQASTADRARAYLDSNCAHCHSPTGPADTSALDLSLATSNALSLGVCKPPIAAGRGSGGHMYGIVPGDAASSILVYRLASTNLSARMPEVGRSLAHTEGVELVSAWVNSLTGVCR